MQQQLRPKEAINLKRTKATTIRDDITFETLPKKERKRQRRIATPQKERKRAAKDSECCSFPSRYQSNPSDDFF